MVRESPRSDFGASRKAPKTKGVTLKRANRRRVADPRAPQQGSSAMWVGHGRAPQMQGLGHPNGRAPSGAGDPLLVPRQPVSAISFDISRCLEGQTTSESYKTRTVVFISKIASQRFENHVDTTSVLREKPRKPKEARSKERTDDAWPTPEPPSRGARPCGSAMAEPCRRRGSAIPWPSPHLGRGPHSGSPTTRFGDILRRFEVFGGSNDL